MVFSDELNLDGADTVRGMLYEYYNENHLYDNEEIKGDFKELYRKMNGMPLRQMDKVIYPSVSCAGTTERLALLKVFDWVFR